MAARLEPVCGTSPRVGGSLVVCTFCCHIGHLDARGRLRRLLGGPRFTNTHAAARDRRAGNHDSSRCGSARDSRVLAKSPGSHGRRDGDVDQHGHCGPHVHVERRRVELGDHRTRPPVFGRVPERRNVRVPLHDSPGDGGDGRGEVTSRSLTTTRR